MATKFYSPENNAIRSTLNGYTERKTIVNGVDGVQASKTAAPLNIVIVGAGIGGLAAAIGLRKNGHNVSVSRNFIIDSV